MSVRYLTARLAQQIDEELMSSAAYAFSLDQLMELAGLACAQTLAKVYDVRTHPRVLVCCGPGNQGGDGLVAARHLGMFGYQPRVFIPKLGSKDIYQRLKTQCDMMQIPSIPPSSFSSSSASNSETTDALEEALLTSDVILDAIFGFSFKPPVRAPFGDVLKLVRDSRLPVVSVDVPSGWDVEAGPPQSEDQKDGVVRLEPDVLLSLTAPKMGVKSFKGRHFLGGRFVPRTLEEKYRLNLPAYPGFEQIVELPRLSEKDPGDQKL
ncbi:hypothetical protein AMATHDRAFT_194838 [Amanita thiersii Skay4041]|uniref:NAD(P)H-hydrate epimerase n=1 Tax=Amanita thiersii Skay4041 TaxID=703135 RepID=A0A2A9NJL1_9AGAR|nr:hypothetical protein AMATHDRAFT_194838 [Amanita thiersii Skay4041]